MECKKMSERWNADAVAPTAHVRILGPGISRPLVGLQRSSQKMNPSPLHELAKLGETVSKAVAMISVPNVSESLAWYESIGFTVLNVYEEDGVMHFAMVALGHAQIMLSLGEPGPIGASLWFYTDKIDELYEAFKKKQTELQ